MTPMKVIKMVGGEGREYLSRPVEETHTKEELEALHRAIKFTKTYLQKESFSRFNEEELIIRPLPK
jgi:hypothetical protein